MLPTWTRRLSLVPCLLRALRCLRIFLLIYDLPEQPNIYTTSFLNKALDSEMVEEEEMDRRCPICVEAIQVGDQVLVVSPASLFSLQLSL